MSLANPFASDDPIAVASEAIIDAASLGRVAALRKAIGDGGNPNHMRLDISASLAAVSGDYLECLQLLVDAGGGGDLPNRMGWTALHEAAAKEDVGFLSVLLGSDFEQNLSVRDRSGWTPLRAAVSAGRLEAVSQLLAAEPSLLDKPDRDGVSPLMAAALARNTFMFQLLLAAGPDLEQTDVNERSVAHCVDGWEEGEELLAEHGVQAPAQPQKATVVAPQAEAPEPQAEPVAANPFGLGKMSKGRKGP
jgi:hypothetical protein